MALHGLDKVLSAQKDLLAQIVPKTLQSDTGSDEVAIRCNRTTAGLSELTQQPIGFQPIRRGALAEQRPVAAPGPIDCVIHHAGPHRVEHDIACEFEEIAVFFHQNGLVAPLKHMADTPVATINVLGVHAIELTHAP